MHRKPSQKTDAGSVNRVSLVRAQQPEIFTVTFENLGKICESSPKCDLPATLRRISGCWPGQPTNLLCGTAGSWQ